MFEIEDLIFKFSLIFTLFSLTILFHCVNNQHGEPS
jgi:hypothetical protein